MQKVILLLLLSGYTAHCQNIYFEKMYDFGDGTGYADATRSLIKDANEKYYFVGRSLNLSNNISEGFLCKINMYGDSVSTVIIEDTNKSIYSTSISKTLNNDLIIGSYVVDISTNNIDYVLTKVNSEFEVLFSYNYGDSIKTERPTYLLNTIDGGSLLVGQSLIPPNDSANMYIVKTDSLGNFEWEQYYGGDYFEAANSAVQTPDSGYMLLGWTQSFGNGGMDWYLVKTDKYGNQEWEKTYGTSVNESANGIISLLDGNYLISGGGGSGSARIRKINPDGDVIWQKSYSYPTGSGGNYLYWAKELPDYSIVAVGGTNNENEIDAGWLIKIDSAGNQLWERKYNKTATVDLFYDFIITDDDGFLLAGMTWNANNSSQDAWLLKVDSMGCEYENCTVGIDEESKKVMVDVWPNPASEVLNIELQDGMKNAELMIQNLEGQVVYARPFDYAQGDKDVIDVNGFANGVYLLTLENEELRTTVKIVVQH